MDAALLRILPAEIQVIVQQIEDRCGRPIGLKPLPEYVRRSIGNVPAMGMDGDGKEVLVDLLLPNGFEPPAHMVAHELFHAKHAVLDGAPMLTPRVGQQTLLDTAINNDFSHLEVIPAEMGLFPEAVAFWTNNFDGGLRQIADRAASDRDRKSLRNDILRFQIVTSRVLPSWPQHDRLNAEISKLNLASDVAHFDQAYEASGSREHILSTFVRFQRLKPDDYLASYAFRPPAVLPRHGN